ncbi:PPP4R2-domain-containing protein [Abortiporus biennis]|nr:PPP4R2-domain-containing protein [Abortiporus biennis]
MSTETLPDYHPDYDALLEQIASTDVIDAEWSRLRDIIKARIQKNVANYLTHPPPDTTALVKQASMLPPRSLPTGGLKLAPFPPRPRLESNPNEAPKHILSPPEVADYKKIIFDQLDDFEGPPFTIQRVCELCLHPEQYKYIGKYLRAVEKSLLVTSTWDAFPIVEAGPAPTTRPINTAIPIGGATLSAPSTPIFSPIPFLHEDARRSQSRSPPPSPLVLAAPASDNIAAIPENKPLGLVDELDDPSPGHLSDHLQPISSTTSTTTSKPLFPTLNDRFTKPSDTQTDSSAAGGTTGASGSDDMAVDEADNKEIKDS